MKEPISILGAGISGLTAAVCLSFSGKNVVIYEKESDVGLNYKNELQAYKNYDHKELDSLITLQEIGLEVRPYSEIHKVIKYSSDNTKREIIDKKNPIYYLFLRGSKKENLPSIEMQLKQQAKELGVKFVFSKSIDNCDIIATGTRRPNILSYGGVFNNVSMENAVYVLYDFKFAPKGYIYVLPYHDKKALIANVCFDKTGMNKVKNLFNRLLKENKEIKEIIKNSELLYTRYGTGGYDRDLLRENRQNGFSIGEAGGFIDPARGFGLKYAFLSGYLVAKAINENLSFEELWQKRFGKELKQGYERRAIFNKLDNDKLSDLIKKMDKKSSVKEYESKRLKLEKESI